MNAKAVLNGLVLIGGQSTRMGSDKYLLTYSEREQYKVCHDLLAPFCQQVYISANSSQQIDADYPVIRDSVDVPGPAAGLLSAYEKEKTAWLVIACDLPLLDGAVIAELVRERNTGKAATLAAAGEPLCAIWEARGLAQLQMSINHYNYSLTRFLRDHDYLALTSIPDTKLQNVNSKDQLQTLELS